MPSLWKILIIMGILLSFFPFIAKGSPIEGEISIPIPFMSNILFDYDVKKNDEKPSPDANPIIEKINQEARKEYHLNHPNWKEFWGFISE